MTTDQTAARLGELLAKAKVAIDNKTGYGGRSFSPYYKSRLIGLVIPRGKDVVVDHVMALVAIAESIPALLAERTAMQAEIARLRGASFQSRVEPWFRECFPPHVCDDRLELSDRFIEEALELVQASGYSAERAHALVDYTFNRPKGEINQEVGGVMVTLAAFCIAHGIDMHQGGEVELARISQPEVIAKIRAKQAAKPTGSALPIHQPKDNENG